MRILLSGNSDRIRVEAVSSNTSGNFIDLEGLFCSVGMSIDLYPSFYYLEMREKAGQLRLFVFERKGVKKDLDLGWWEDAKVIWSRN